MVSLVVRKSLKAMLGYFGDNFDSMMWVAEAGERIAHPRIGGLIPGSKAVEPWSTLSPEEFVALARAVDDRRRKGGVLAIELGFAPPKSVSIAALADLGVSREIIAMHRSAVDDALIFMSPLLVAREKKRLTECGVRLMEFLHPSNRATEPQLHSHVLVLRDARYSHALWTIQTKSANADFEALSNFRNCEQDNHISLFLGFPGIFPPDLSLIFPSEKRPQTALFDHQRSPNDFWIIARRAFIHGAYRGKCHSKRVATLTGFELVRVTIAVSFFLEFGTGLGQLADMKRKAIEKVNPKAVAIYEEPVVSKGKTYVSYRISYYHEGKRCRERAATLEEAKKRADELAKDMPSDTKPFTKDQVRTLNNAVDTLAPLNIRISDAAAAVVEAQKILNGRGTIQEAARMYAKTSARDELIPITFGDLYKEFMLKLASEGTAKTREYEHSYRYWQDCSQRLGAAAEVFKKTQVADITTRDLEDFLDKLPIRRRTSKGVVFIGEHRKVVGRTRNNYRGALCTIFSYARKQRYLTRNVETEAECITEAGEKAQRKDGDLRKRIYTAEEMQTILDNLPTKWIPLVVLGAFAGIRTAEIRRLEWQDVDWAAGHIELEKRKTKVGRRRLLMMSEQLQAWLKPIAKEEGWIIPHHAQDSTTGIEFGKWRNRIPVRKPANGCRDAYASYRYCELDDTSKVAHAMGTSGQMLSDNYLGLVDKLQLAAWKKVLPKKGYPASSDKNAERLKELEKAGGQEKKFVKK